MRLSRWEICVLLGLMKACALEGLGGLIIKLFLSSFTRRDSDRGFAQPIAAAV